MSLDDEAARATEMLAGKTVVQVWRHSLAQFGLEFTDGTRLFVDGDVVDGERRSPVEISITSGRQPTAQD